MPYRSRATILGQSLAALHVLEDTPETSVTPWSKSTVKRTDRAAIDFRDFFEWIQRSSDEAVAFEHDLRLLEFANEDDSSDTLPSASAAQVSSVEQKTPFFPNNPSSMSEIFRPDSTGLSFANLAGFAKWYASGSTGYLDESICVTTLVGKMLDLKRLFRWRTDGETISRRVFGSTLRYIETELQQELNLNTATKPKLWFGLPELEQLVKAILSPSFAVAMPDQRFQMVQLVSILWDHSLRIGALMPLAVGDPYITWGDMTIIVVRNPTTGNRITIECLPVSGKTAASFDMKFTLEMSTRTWLCPVLFTLLRAHHCGALPPGYTVSDLLSPTLFADGSTSHKLRFADSFLKEPIFVGHRSKAPTTQSGFPKRFAQASILAGLSHRVTPHMIRRSSVISLKSQGVTFDQISRQLRHTWLSTTHDSYIGKVTTVDAAKAVFGDDAPVAPDVLEVQPLRINQVTKTLNRALPQDVREQIFEQDAYIDAFEAYNAECDRLCERHAVSSIHDIDVKTRNQELRAPWARITKIYQGLLAELTVHYVSINFGVLGDERLEKGNSSTTTEAGDLSVEERVLDAMPDGEVAGYDLDAAEEYLRSTDFLSQSDTATEAYNAGYTDNPTYLAQMSADPPNQAPAPPSFDSIPIDPVLLALDGPQPILAESSTPAVSKSKKKSKRSSTSFEDEDKEDDGEGDDTTGDISLDFITPWNKAMSSLFEPGGMTWLQTFETICAIPNESNILSFGFRPGHYPANGICPFCDTPVKDHSDERISESVSTFLKVAADRRRVYACAAKQQAALIGPALLRRYPWEVETNPITGRTPNLKKTDKIGFTNFDVVGLTHKASALLLQSRMHNRFAKCKPCGVDLPTLQLLREHVFVTHRVWLPPSVGPSIWTKRIGPENWTLENAAFPKPVYYTFDGRYHGDPLELYHFAQEYYESRIASPSASVSSYGLRGDILPLAANDRRISARDRNGNPCDTKYDYIRRPGGVVETEGLCMLCVNDTNLDWAARMFPHSTEFRKAFRSHNKFCLRDRLEELYSLKEIADDPTFRRPDGVDYPFVHSYLWDSNEQRIRCPDPVCARSSRQFIDPLAWVRHLVGVHQYDLWGRKIGPSDRYELNELCLGDQGEMDEFISNKTLVVSKRQKTI